MKEAKAAGEATQQTEQLGNTGMPVPQENVFVAKAAKPAPSMPAMPMGRELGACPKIMSKGLELGARPITSRKKQAVIWENLQSTD